MIENKYPKLQKACSGLLPVGAIIVNADCIYILFEDELVPNKVGEHGCRVVSYYPKMDGVWALKHYGGFKKLQGAVSSDGRLVVCSVDGAVLGQPDELDNTKAPVFLFEFPLSSKRINVTRVRAIAGTVYIVTKGQAVYSRSGIEHWKCLLKNPPIKLIGKNGGFTDIDGFAENDLYACGGRGVLWHFDGVDWEVVRLPVNLSLESDLYFQTICCTPDGSVYIGCKSGAILYGKYREWSFLTGKLPSKIIDMISYQDKLYLACGKKGLYVYDSVNLTLVNIKNDVTEAPSSANKLSTDGNILVVTGESHVHTFDGADWEVLYAPQPTS